MYIYLSIYVCMYIYFPKGKYYEYTFKCPCRYLEQIYVQTIKIERMC